MYIENIVINGFKSYAKEVIVDGFDRHFNAITGPNGSGKSNILDAICFVLGIKNLDAVRASNLQDLVYKQGQAGVTKAMVSITFDNQDERTSPTGYTDKKKITVTRQIQVGGRDKYLINGRTVEKNRVQDMFHTVQLNVNNPHFLIMQGRITKVLAMRPQDILGLLEEAAGTKMYDKKREVALKTLEKKQARLTEIDQLMREELKPRLEKLKEEKAEYVAYMKAAGDLDALAQLVQAYEFWSLCEAAKAAGVRMEELHATTQEVEDAKRDAEMDLASKREQIAAVQTEVELQQGGAIQAAQARADEAGVELAKREASLESAQDDIRTAEAERERLRAALAEVSEEWISGIVHDAEAKAAASRAALEAASAALENAEAELTGLESGDGRDASNRSLVERIADAESDKKEQQAELQRAEAVVQHLRASVVEAEADAQRKEQSDAALQRELAERHRAVDAARAALAAQPLDQERLAALEAEADGGRAAVERLRQQRQALAAEVGSFLTFDFKSPRAGFDRAAVKGALARLVRVLDPAHATALGVAAGGKLHHIVVTTADVGAALLKGGNLKRRVTIVPLDKTRASVVAPDKQREAARSTDGRARLALDLVGYQDADAAAMAYAFGATFVCDDAQAAQKVAFSRGLACRSVTVAGDDFNPHGTLTGGARGTAKPVLAILSELAQVDQELEQRQAELNNVTEELQALNGAVRKHQAARERLDMVTHELNLVNARVESSAGHQARMAADKAKEDLACAEAEQRRAEDQIRQLADSIEEMRRTAQALEKDRGAIVKKAGAAVEKARGAHTAAQAAALSDERAMAHCVARQSQADTERADLTAQLAAADRQLSESQVVHERLVASVEETRHAFETGQREVEDAKGVVARCADDMRALGKEQTALERRIKELDGKAKSAAQSMSKLDRDAQEARSQIQDFEKGHERLLRQRDSFGVPGSTFDFNAMDMRAKQQEHEALTRSVQELERTVNRHVMNTLRQVEEDFTSLEARRDTVEADREKIVKVIEELDTKKESALEMTWREVGASFADIFSTLLPGAAAALEPPAGCHFLQGLAVRVAFGGVWKESLSELSGGQRSLLALSLILALLKFRPAPLYILDEVDAALDLSHTQNIGRMIKEHFPHAQFVIVSLKEGMFNNANVIFRTRFVDGTSTVRRTANTGKQAAGHHQKRQRSSAVAQQENRRAQRA